jgi:hypothetical protein
MAIDFGRMIQGVATGAMGQYNAEVAAKDKMKGNIIERAGLNFYENTLPEFEKKEKSRKETYDKLSGQFGVDVAEYMGQNNFITGDANDYKNILIQLGDNPEIKADKIKQYLKATDSSYTKRAESRFDAIKEREKTIMGLTTGDSKIGTMTAQLQIPESTPITETTEEVVTPAVEGTQVGPQVTEAVPEKREMKTTALPTYEEIFGDGKEKMESNFFALTPSKRKELQGQSDQQYKTIYTNKITGMTEHPQTYKDNYNALPDSEKDSQTLQQYSYNRYFRERYLPETGLTYGTASTETSEPPEIAKGRLYIDMYKANGDDKMVEEVRTRLKNAGFDLTKYSL